MNDEMLVEQGLEKTPKTVVLVTNQFECERLIRAGRLIANISGTNLTVLNVQNSEYPQNPQALEFLFGVSKQNDAMMTVLYAEQAYQAITHYIKDHKVHNVVTGMPGSENSVLHKLWNKFTHISFFTVDSQGQHSQVTYKGA